MLLVNMKKMDPEMVMEIPDTPERGTFTRSVGESSSHARRTNDKPSSSNQYLEPTTGTSSCQMKNSTLYGFGGDNASPPLDDDIQSQQTRINRVRSSSEPMGSSVVFNGDGASPEMIDLSQESPCPTRHIWPWDKERKPLGKQSETKELNGSGKLGGHDFNDVNTVSLDGDFLFSQASIARSISSTHDTRPKNSHGSSPKPDRSGVSNSRTSPKMIDLGQGSPFPVPYPTKHRGSRPREEKCLRTQSGRNERSDFDKPGMRPLISSDDLRKERSNASKSSNDFGSSNATKLESVRCHATGVSSRKEEVAVRQPNSRARNEQLQLRNSDFSFQRSILQQNKLHNVCISSFDTNTSNNGQVKEDCKDIKSSSSQRTPSPVGNQVTETGNEYCKVSESTREADHSHTNTVLNPKKNGRRMLVRNGCISPSNIAQNKTVTKDKGIDKGGFPGKMPDSNSTKSTRVNVDLHPKNNGHRTVVQNGCAFSSHTARDKNEGGVISSRIPNGNSSKLAHSSNFECCETDKMKGKRIMNEELANSQHSWTIPTSRRSCLLPGKELTIMSDMDSDSGRIRAGHTTGISASESASSHLSSSKVEISKGRSLSVTEKPEVATLQSGENNTQVHGSFKLDSEVPQHTGKRKNSFTHSNTGECSSSTVGSSSISCDWRSTRPLRPRTTRNRKSVRIDTALAPIVEIDEFDCYTTEDNHELSDECIAKSIQLESDEILARQLQEQFYLESPPVGAAEVGSTIEWSLLQENLPASRRRQNHSHLREALIPSLFGQSRFPQPFTRMAARSRARSIGRMRRNLSRPSMSVEERMDFLEALEAAFENADMETPDHFLDGERDFDENDYEMLLALDENNHHVGASERQINNLPQSLFQPSTDSEEACAVCLETPSVGDTVRHLPCLHRFHKDCIDTWLRRKRSCPICKCGIT